jgi:X-Pro dipeptidyl-peptidase
MRASTSASTALTVCAVTALAYMAAPVAGAEAPAAPEIVVADELTQPVFGYADAIRERVWVDTGVDSDRDGANDVVRVDLIRPAATEAGLDVPVIIDDSPYYTTLGRGNESELKADLDGDGLLDRWPLFYDNYFVPRGYAVALVDMTGTAGSTGCPTIQGANENVSGPVVIDWLNGRRSAHDADGNPVVVDWHNGKSAMIGKSYDGALAMAGAVSGVDGLATVVPISGPYNYYDYTRSNGIVMRGNNYLVSLARTITNDDPARQTRCTPVWNEIAAADGDEHGDYTPFWAERDYLDDAAAIKASVFLVHGIQDENVRPDHFSKFWQKLGEYDIARKLWIGRVGHIEPFDFRRAEWVDTLHRWFDYWLHGIDNGITDEPKVDVQTSTGAWEQYADWPIPTTGNVNLWLRGSADGAGSFALTPSLGAPESQSFVDNPNQFESAMIGNPNPAQREPPRLPVHAARGRPTDIWDASGQPHRLVKPGRGLLRRDPRRIRPEHPERPSRRRYPADHAARGVLRRVERVRRRVLPTDYVPAHQRQPVAGDQGHPRRSEPQLDHGRRTDDTGRDVRNQLSDAARGLHLLHRQPNRADPRRQLPQLLSRADLLSADDHRRYQDQSNQSARPRWPASRSSGRDSTPIAVVFHSPFAAR